ncbi:DUF3142 domain-containing protein [Tahibacter soli]|uniref:DUF3142 domain-containing protein n=1 Tax=Tahibacter soli TaxID=2983605 RepID=A0A9X3YMX6_9GAMM|nr:DUF3142 domain-containing protein [Tahibacter soli]MDC8015321.1 DUF3142 domain-containing protein [Tahibacter soli]
MRSIADSRDVVAGLRVLALQRDAHGRGIEPQADLAALAADARPVVAVVRIDGRIDLHDDAADVARVVELARRWRDAGVAVAGIEIDHDCATARLDAYAGWLARLRAALPAATRVSITALPAWRAAPALARVIGAVDETVLQVHAVADPSRGLFDRTQARGWIDAWAKRSADKPFRVALPAYGAALRLDADGGVLAVESEQPLATAAAEVREIAVDPRDVASLVRELEVRRPATLAGIVWFRLPRDGDRRAWRMSTLRAVIAGAPLAANLRIALRPSGGAFDVVATNDGTLDAELPPALRVAAACTGDGIAGYRYEPGARVQFFRRDTHATLRAGGERVLGWLRCGSTEAGDVGIEVQ